MVCTACWEEWVRYQHTSITKYIAECVHFFFQAALETEPRASYTSSVSSPPLSYSQNPSV